MNTEKTIDIEIDNDSEDSEELYTCDDCHEEFPEDYIVSVSESLHSPQYEVCHDCCNDNYVQITGNNEYGRWISTENAVILADGTAVAEDDAEQCDHCSEWFEPGELRTLAYCGDAAVCDGCLSDSDYIYCEDIEDYASEYDAHYSEEDGCCYYYESNMPDSEDEYGNMDYSADVLDHRTDGRRICLRKVQDQGYVYTHPDGKTLMYGIELEIERRSGGCDLVDCIQRQDAATYGIWKYDGSVNGTEFVTVPATLDAHRNVMNWGDFCENVAKVGRGHYGRDNGMHIHVNRDAITALTLGKILVFMNNASNFGFLSTIAQREVDNHWCQQNPGAYKKVGDCGKYPNKSGKYSIVNVTRQTLEFRMFNSTLLAARIEKNIEFIDALIHYCRNTSARALRENPHPWVSFYGYVRRNRKDYPALFNYLNERIHVTPNHIDVSENADPDSPEYRSAA